MQNLEHITTGETASLVEHVDLQSAHVTQLNSGGSKGEWVVKKNITGDHLYSFAATINDKDMFAVLNFARHFELVAFNSGIKFQKDKNNEYLTAQLSEVKRINLEFADENVRLATLLENLLPEE